MGWSGVEKGVENGDRLITPRPWPAVDPYANGLVIVPSIHPTISPSPVPQHVSRSLVMFSHRYIHSLV